MDEYGRPGDPRRLARIAGVLYLVIIVIGVFGEMYIRGGIVVSGDEAATAANIRAQESLWRFGIAAEAVLLSSAIAVALILLVLLRPVSLDLAWLSIFFNLTAIAVEAVSSLFLAAALLPLGKAGYLAALPPEQAETWAMLAVRMHSHGFALTLIFFGFVCLIWGYLIYRSGYLPKVIGALLAVAGLCYLINSFAFFLAPALARQLFPAILVPAFIAESSLALWLLIKGVNLEQWNRRQA